MIWDPSDLLVVALVVLGTAVTIEAYITYRWWWRRWRADRRPSPPPRRVHPRAWRDVPDDAPYGHSISLRK
jgi:uncharacterized iron-regulated membrane protein